jgi:hypothetical protein
MRLPDIVFVTVVHVMYRLRIGKAAYRLSLAKLEQITEAYRSVQCHSHIRLPWLTPEDTQLRYEFTLHFYQGQVDEAQRNLDQARQEAQAAALPRPSQLNNATVSNLPVAIENHPLP